MKKRFPMSPSGLRDAAVLTLAAVISIAGSPARAGAQPLDPATVLAQPKRPQGAFRGARPSGPNPYLSFLPAEAKPDYAAWNQWLGAQGKALRSLQPPADPTKLITAGESEPNGTQATADAVPGFGTGLGDDPAADLSGSLAAPPPPTIIGPFAEDNGSIPLANPTGLVSGATVRTSGTIGDGPYGGTSGDFDFFTLSGLAAGDEILIDVDTPLPFCCDLDPYVGIWSAAGVLLAANDDQPAGNTYDSYLVFDVPAAGTYYVSIGGYPRPFPSDPFNSGSGSGVASTGTYDITIGVNALDSDYFSFDLEPGDVIASNLLGSFGMRAALYDPSGAQRIGSGQNLSFIMPGPFPAGGVAGFAYVVETAGTYTVRASGTSGAYTLEMRGFRPSLEGQVGGAVQTLFVDFDGATIDPAIFGGPPGSTALSPLASFLPGWGLTPADESDVIDAIVDQMVENLSTDMRVLAANGDYDVTQSPGDFDIVLLNSRDHADPFGDPNVSRVIIGGTIPELGIGTIGIAQSIDPGNFSTSETAVVLLDLLSAPSSDPNSLNQFPLGGGATKVELVGAGVGNIASHEAGHFFANFHTNQFNAQANVMDQGGNLPNHVGVGPDLTFGTGDDADVDFGADQYVPNEGLTGTEDTLNAVAFGLSTGVRDCPLVPIGTCSTAGKASVQLKDRTPDTQDLLSFRWLRGPDMLNSDFGDPRSSALYRICVYDAAGLVRDSIAPAGGLCSGRPCWKQTGPASNPGGYVYRDPQLTPDGTSTITLKSGVVPRPTVLWKAKGAPLGDGSLGLVPPVVVEVSNSETAVCFGQTFGASDVTTNTPQQFKASVP